MAPEACFTLSGFADEISPDIKVQTQHLNHLRVKGLDLRSVNSVNVLDLTEHDLIEVRKACEDQGLHVQAVGSPVNKVTFTPENEKGELQKLTKAIHVAKVMNIQRIRIFSPEVPEAEQESSAEGVLAWMSAQIELAKKNDVVLLHENDARFWGAYPTNARRMFKELGCENFRAAFDFANTVLIGFRPFPDWFPWILPHLDTLHIKDAIQAEGKVVPAGEGEGDVAKTITWLVSQGWHGPLTLEPHLAAAGKFGGFSGAALFTEATSALRNILTDIGVDL